MTSVMLVSRSFGVVQWKAQSSSKASIAFKAHHDAFVSCFLHFLLLTTSTLSSPHTAFVTCGASRVPSELHLRHSPTTPHFYQQQHITHSHHGRRSVRCRQSGRLPVRARHGSAAVCPRGAEQGHGQHLDRGLGFHQSNVRILHAANKMHR